MRRPLSIVCLVAVVFLFFGTKIIHDSPPGYIAWEGQEVTVTGKVYKKETTTGEDKNRQIVYLKLIAIENKQSEISVIGDERVICYLNVSQEMPEMGSVIQASGKMKCFESATNPGQFDAKSYYHILHISFQLNQTEIHKKTISYNQFAEALYKFREKCADILDKTLPDKDASVIKTMLLGDKKATDEERKKLYQRNGIAHIQAISGLHISVIGMTLYSLLKKSGIPIVVRAAIPVAVMIGYGCMTGFTVSVIRAVGMFVLHMIAVMCRRTYDMLTAIAVLALCILVEQPLYLYNSSFLLSFGCVLGIGLLLPALTKKRLKKEKEPAGFTLKVMSGATVSIAIFPLQLLFFYQVPIYSVFLNLLVIPLMSIILSAGIILLFVGALSSFLGLSGAVLCKPIAIVIEITLNTYDFACHVCEWLPAGLFTAGCPATWRIVVYVGILILIVLFQRKISLKRKWLMAAGAVAFLLWPMPARDAVTFLDVGQGDCIHIESKAGNHYLVDGGSSSVSNVGEYRILPYLKYHGIREVEAVFVTHPDEDHCNGIGELFGMAKEEGITVRRLYLPDIGVSAKTEKYYELVQVAEKNGISVEYLSKDMCLQDGALSLYCLHPGSGYETEDENEYSLVLLMQYRGVRRNTGLSEGENATLDVLLTGDVEEDGELELLQTLQELDIKDVEVLKVAHHGSRNSSSEEFLKQIGPSLAVISCGENNNYGHPHEETLSRLEEHGALILNTPDYGAVTVEFQEQMKVRSWKNQRDEKEERLVGTNE